MFENKAKGGFLKIFLTSLVTSLVVGVLLLAVVSGSMNANRPRQPAAPQLQNQSAVPPQTQNPAPLPQQLSAGQAGTAGMYVAETVAKSAMPGVVGVTVLRVESKSLFDKNAGERWGVGTGVIMSSNGYILTNHHVAGGTSKRIIVSLVDGRNIDGTTLWSDPVLDLAVVKINATGLTPIPVGDATTLQVGEPAIAIGNPLGLEFQRTVTSGIISALNRTIRIDTDKGPNYMEDLIQTDASINPGNSGGPLLNSRGQVVGINTIKVASAESIGFAIPINVAVPIIKKYVTDGSFKEPYLGVFAYDKAVIPYVDASVKLDNGVYVAHVDRTGPAFKGGIKEGCIIKQVDGININTMLQLRSYLYTKNPGDTIRVLHLARDTGKLENLEIKLAQKTRDGLVTR